MVTALRLLSALLTAEDEAVAGSAAAEDADKHFAMLSSSFKRFERIPEAFALGDLAAATGADCAASSLTLAKMVFKQGASF